MRLGAAFDPSHDGEGPALTREGGHSHNRIVHSGGDRSGAEVQRTLDENALAAGVEVLDRAFALDLLVGIGADGGPQAAGVRIARIDEAGDVVSVGDVTARAVVLATGGYGQVFASTSNPPAVTGDGLALALRAGLAGARRGVRPVPPHRAVGRARCDRSAGADQRGGAWRGRRAVRRSRGAGDGRGASAGGPRAARRGGRGDQPADGRGARRRGRPRVPRRDAHGRAVLRALPGDHRGLSRRRHRPGARNGSPWRLRRTSPAAACAPTSTGAPRWSGCTPSARWPAPGCTGPTGWPATA